MYHNRLAYIAQKIETDERKKQDALKRKENEKKVKEKKDGKVI